MKGFKKIALQCIKSSLCCFNAYMQLVSCMTELHVLMTSTAPVCVRMCLYHCKHVQGLYARQAAYDII